MLRITRVICPTNQVSSDWTWSTGVTTQGDAVSGILGQTPEAWRSARCRAGLAHSLLGMSASATDVSVDPLSFEGSPCKRLGVQAFLRLNFDRRRNVGAAKSYNRLSIVGYWNRLPVPY